ncbi:hypothetical protein EHF33_13620 [Deinococcus psychrotolerans]|uniref:Uncharacterized protein n=1 Tax=Deinococcus psychrotolerans TaxID=2489213 RepID=A0A3G8YE51_9DEIO|nr:hypothetical protein [Deinococcus psychrotolerans]AZI43659.1 hypothetical protein EHF33_13620 [Deinococcus psychrotolerans]
MNAIIGAFQSVQFVIERGAQIASVIMDAFNSVGAIAAGNISGAAGLVERSLAGAIPLALSFVAKLVGIGNLGGKIKNIITKVRGRLDGLVDKMVGKVKGLLAKLGVGKDGKAEANNSENDVRSLSQKSKDVDSAIAEADLLMKRPNASPKSVKSSLVGIKIKYKLNILNLVKESDGEYHIFGKINPENIGPSRKLSDNQREEIK